MPLLLLLGPDMMLSFTKSPDGDMFSVFAATDPVDCG